MLFADTALPDPSFFFQAYAPQEDMLRYEYRLLEDAEQPSTGSRSELEGIFRKSALLLEIFAVALYVHEALDELKAQSIPSSGKSFEFFVDRVRKASGLNLRKVLDDASELLPLTPPPTPLPAFSTATLVRATRSFLEACPIDIMETLGAELQFEQWANRCRVAYNMLRAFMLRNDEKQQHRLRIIGKEYLRAALSVDDVAVLLDVHPVDAIWLLEQNGYHRSVDVIVLEDDERSDRLARIRADRLMRSGIPQPSDDLIFRDVVSSQRIENIDARAWLSRKNT
jgi:hypothetical protein